jgi:hypothetical protein
MFQQIASVSPGIDLQRGFAIEKEINDFLANESIEFIDIKLSGSAAAVGDRIAHYGLTALLLYKQTT